MPQNSMSPCLLLLALAIFPLKSVGSLLSLLGAVFGNFMHYHVLNHYHTSGNDSQLFISNTELFTWVPVLNFYQRDSSLGLSHLYLKLMFMKLKSYFSTPHPISVNGTYLCLRPSYPLHKFRSVIKTISFSSLFLLTQPPFILSPYLDRKSVV